MLKSKRMEMETKKIHLKVQPVKWLHVSVLANSLWEDILKEKISELSSLEKYIL